jgi:glutathione S-transferase
MKLYYKPGACSQAPHIALREAGLAFTPVPVDLAQKKLEDGSDYFSINPKGYVPALALDTGEVLTENAAVLQYIADLAPAKGLAPAAGTIGRYRVQEWLSFISSELHKSFSPLFAPSSAAEVKAAGLAKLGQRLPLVEKHLAEREVLVGEHFSVADIYLFVVLGWAPHVGVDLSPYPKVQAYLKRIGERPAVKEALQAEFPGKR